MNETIVMQDLHLVVRNQNGQKPAAPVFSRPIFRHPRSRGATVMTVGDIEPRDSDEPFLEEPKLLFFGDHPSAMPDAVF